MMAENGYLRADGMQDGHRYQTMVIATKRDGAPLTKGESPPAQGLATVANFLFMVDGDSTAPYEPYLVATQLPTVRNLGIQYICMKCRRGSQDWERLPRLGFDAPIDQYLLANFAGFEFALADNPVGVDDLTVRAVLDTEAGRNWWHSQGPIEPIMYFDCAAGAESGLILAPLDYKRGGSMRTIDSDEWQYTILRPRVWESQRRAEAKRLARWSDAWHDHLVEVYAQAMIDQIGRIGDDFEEG
jgi:hypothetical protein